MTDPKKFLTYLLLCSFFINNMLISYPVLGEFYRCGDQDGHTILILVDKIGTDKSEKEYKASVIPSIRKLLTDNEVDMILPLIPQKISDAITKMVNDWNNEFESDPKWNSIVEQNYSNAFPPITYRKANLTPREATRLFVSLSKMKNYINNLPLKEHLNFTQKTENKEGNNLKSHRAAKDFFLNKQSAQISASITFADWCTPAISYIAENYTNGVKVLPLNNDDNELELSYLRNLVQAFIPQDINSTEFYPENDLKIKNLLNDLEVVIKKLDHFLSNPNISNQEKDLWENYRIRILNAREYILNAVIIFKNLSPADKNNFEQLFKTIPKYQYAQVHWFAIVYAYVLKNKDLQGNIYQDLDIHWAKLLTEDLLYIGLMDAIIKSKNNQTKAILYLNESNYSIISQNLLNFGYSKTLVFDNRQNNNSISSDELQLLVNQFSVNVLRIKQLLEKPIVASIVI